MKIKDYKLFESYEIDLKNVTILDIFMADGRQVGFEGGLTIIFKKDLEKGLVIIGFNELGSWIEHYQVGSKVKNLKGFADGGHLNKKQVMFIKELVYQYNIDGFYDE